MGGACNNVWGWSLVEKHEVSNNLEDPDVNGRIIFKNGSGINSMEFINLAHDRASWVILGIMSSLTDNNLTPPPKTSLYFFLWLS